MACLELNIIATFSACFVIEGDWTLPIPHCTGQGSPTFLAAGLNLQYIIHTGARRRHHNYPTCDFIESYFG